MKMSARARGMMPWSSSTVADTPTVPIVCVLPLPVCPYLRRMLQ